MASNFGILTRRKNDSLNLKLIGDFDGNSACELLNLLKEKCDGVKKVVIHTSGLKDIYPFGKDTFQNNLYTLKDKRVRFVFKGKNAGQLVPERRKTFLNVVVP
jgi:hypothetical protein